MGSRHHRRGRCASRPRAVRFARVVRGAPGASGYAAPVSAPPLPAAPLQPPPPDRAAALRVNRRGIQLMVGAMACFIANDSLVKLVSEALPAGQLIFLRGVMATLLVIAFARATGAELRLPVVARPAVALRAGIDGLATFLYLVALFNMPIANATAINMAAPLFIVALAGPLLGERVDARRWLAVGAGFGGVLLVIQPSAEGFDLWALVCLVATLLHALRDFATRRIPAGVSSIAITLATASLVTVLAALLSAVQGWQPPGARELGLLAAAAVFLAVGYHLVIRSTREGEFSVIAPFRYTGLLLALLVGWVVWGDLPNLLGWGGIVLLMLAGLYLIHCERRRAR